MEPFESRFQQFLAGCTEDYLIRYANKGLYNRAQKDMDKGITVDYEWTDNERVQATLSDGIVVQLSYQIEQCECSCPAEQLCKHILIAILYHQRHHQIGTGTGTDSDVGMIERDINEESPVYSDNVPASETLAEQHSKHSHSQANSEESALTERFRWLLDTPLSQLLQSFTTAQLEEAEFRLARPQGIELLYDTLLTVRLIDYGVEVSFRNDPHADPAQALCTVKGKDALLYKLEALLRYRQHQGLQDQPMLEQHMYSFASHPQVMKECRELFGEWLQTGLARLPQTMTARLETLAVAAHSEALPNLESMLRGIQGELELFFARHVRFNMSILLNRLTSAYLTLEAWEQEQSPARRAELAGSFRSKYYRIPILELYGIGAEPWETLSGYKGITYYLYSLTDRQIYTYSDTRPVYYEANSFQYQSQYNQSCPWRANLPLRQLSQEQWIFRGIKANRDYRLSASDSSGMEQQPRHAVEEVDFGAYTLSSVEQLHHTLQPSLFGEKKMSLHMLQLSSIQSVQFDRLTQTTIITAQTPAEESVSLIIPDHPEWRTMVQELERSTSFRSLIDCYALVQSDGVNLYPVSFLQQDRLINLKLDGAHS
ncbi:SWIM zinc finger family protein [Paenibacillus kandeliae]|uniref:SWIM zinc finger family protein n=1 Tax=Paenibacillus kandeliae TaxID=3231269 RepID=UPI00345B19DB